MAQDAIARPEVCTAVSTTTAPAHARRLLQYCTCQGLLHQPCVGSCITLRCS
jgi:hypothetical protein